MPTPTNAAQVKIWMRTIISASLDYLVKETENRGYLKQYRDLCRQEIKLRRTRIKELK